LPVPDKITIATPPNGSVEALHNRPGFLIRRAHQITAALFEGHSGGIITQAQFSVLYVLHQRPGADQITVAKLIGHDRSTTALVLGKAEKAGWVTRRPDDDDRRRNVLVLTEEGEAMLGRAIGFVRATQAQLLSVFDEEEAEDFCRLLDKFVTAFNDSTRAPIPSQLP
jgi:MarR family transcriptional regulator, lower aerobic nicotinate degradation pathway regulator